MNVNYKMCIGCGQTIYITSSKIYICRILFLLYTYHFSSFFNNLTIPMHAIVYLSYQFKKKYLHCKMIIRIKENLSFIDEGTIRLGFMVS